MVDMRTIYPLIMSADVDASTAFYTEVVGLEVAFDTGWFRLFCEPGSPSAQLAVIERQHPSIPGPDRGARPAGFLVTIDRQDCDEVYSRAVAAGASVVVPPTDEAWGQRHTMLRDPDGTLVDVVVDRSGS